MKFINFIFAIMLVVFSVVYMQLGLDSFNNNLFDACFICAVIAVAAFFIASQKKGGKGYWLKPSYLFVGAYMAVNFQYLLDLRLGLKTLSSGRFLYSIILNHCAVLSVLGILAFVIGYGMRPLRKREEDAYIITQSGKNDFSFPQLIVFLQIVVFLLFLLTSDLASMISGAGYGVDDVSAFENLLYVINAIVVLFVVWSQSSHTSFVSYIKRFPVVSLAIFLLYCIMRLLSGDRGPFIYSILLFFFGYLYYSRKRLNLIVVLVLLIGSMLLASLVGIARGYNTHLSFGKRMSDAYDQFSSEGRFGNDDETIFDYTDELGFSFYVNQVDVYAVEVKGESLHYLSYPVYALLSGIPFAPTLIQKSFGVSPEDFSSAGFANKQFFGGYDRSWGIGTTILGFFYLSFGFIGVIVGLFFTGLFLRYLDSVILIKNKRSIGIYELLFVLLFAAKAVYMPRATVFLEIPRFIWGVILLVCIMPFIKSKFRKYVGQSSNAESN